MSKKHTIKPVDRDLHRAIWHFAAKQPAITYAEQFADQLCRYLQEEGFDLDCVLRYKEGYFEVEE